MKLRSDVATSDPVATVGYRSGAEACIEMLRRRWLLVLVAGGGDCGRELAPVRVVPGHTPVPHCPGPCFDLRHGLEFSTNCVGATDSLPLLARGDEPLSFLHGEAAAMNSLGV